MKRPSYRSALEWMALNDDVYWVTQDPNGPGAVSVTGCLTCDLFDVDHDKLRVDLLKVMKRVCPNHPALEEV